MVTLVGFRWGSGPMDPPSHLCPWIDDYTVADEQELIQNADDAEASTVKFLLDYSTYGTDASELYHKDLASFQV